MIEQQGYSRFAKEAVENSKAAILKLIVDEETKEQEIIDSIETQEGVIKNAERNIELLNAAHQGVKIRVSAYERTLKIIEEQVK